MRRQGPGLGKVRKGTFDLYTELASAGLRIDHHLADQVTNDVHRPVVRTPIVRIPSIA
jgi:hypothetical protein